MTDVPHFAIPFRFAGPQAAVVEQDSIDEIAYSVYTVLVTPQGSRVDLPEFGLPDLTFTTQPIDREVIRATIEEWEPRALVEFSDDDLVAMARSVGVTSDDQLAANVPVQIQVRSEE